MNSQIYMKARKVLVPSRTACLRQGTSFAEIEQTGKKALSFYRNFTVEQLAALCRYEEVLPADVEHRTIPIMQGILLHQSCVGPNWKDWDSLDFDIPVADNPTDIVPDHCDQCKRGGTGIQTLTESEFLKLYPKEIEESVEESEEEEITLEGLDEEFQARKRFKITRAHTKPSLDAPALSSDLLKECENNVLKKIMDTLSTSTGEKDEHKINKASNMATSTPSNKLINKKLQKGTKKLLKSLKGALGLQSDDDSSDASDYESVQDGQTILKNRVEKKFKHKLFIELILLKERTEYKSYEYKIYENIVFRSGRNKSMKALPRPRDFNEFSMLFHRLIVGYVKYHPAMLEKFTKYFNDLQKFRLTGNISDKTIIVYDEKNRASKPDFTWVDFDLQAFIQICLEHGESLFFSSSNNQNFQQNNNYNNKRRNDYVQHNFQSYDSNQFNTHSKQRRKIPDAVRWKNGYCNRLPNCPFKDFCRFSHHPNHPRSKNGNPQQLLLPPPDQQQRN